MLRRVCANATNKLGRQWGGGQRHVSFSEQLTKDAYLMKINLDPFKENEVKVTVNKGEVHLDGQRGEKTGVSDWSHEVHMVFSLPPTVKLDSVKTTFNNGNTLLVTADSASA